MDSLPNNTHRTIISIPTVSKNLYEYLKEIPDFRRWQGQRHTLSHVLLILIMATMSWYSGIRATGDFIERHKQELLTELWITKKRLPNFATVGRILQHIDYTEFEKAFLAWARNTIPVETWEWISLDGKAIGWTVTNPHNASQKYTHLISAFHSTRQQVLWMSAVSTDKQHEIWTVRQLIHTLWLTGVIFTLDALHCQKETTKTIIVSGNDYVIGVKGNQKWLLGRVKKTVPSDIKWVKHAQKRWIVVDKRLET